MVYSIIDIKTKNIHNPYDITTTSVIHVKYLSARDYLKDFVFNLSIIKPEGYRKNHQLKILEIFRRISQIKLEGVICQRYETTIFHGHSSKVSQNASD